MQISVAAIFIAQMSGMELGFAGIVTVCLTSTAASMSSASVPSAALVLLIMVRSDSQYIVFCSICVRIPKRLASLVGLAVSQSLILTGMVQYGIRQINRVNDYNNISHYYVITPLKNFLATY